MDILCFCRRVSMDIEHATYAINGVPCCSAECYDNALEAQGVCPGRVVMVTVRRQGRVQELAS
jgi:hypothetical protein